MYNALYSLWYREERWKKFLQILSPKTFHILRLFPFVAWWNGVTNYNGPVGFHYSNSLELEWGKLKFSWYPCNIVLVISLNRKISVEEAFVLNKKLKKGLFLYFNSTCYYKGQEYLSSFCKCDYYQMIKKGNFDVCWLFYILFPWL